MTRVSQGKPLLCTRPLVIPASEVTGIVPAHPGWCFFWRELDYTGDPGDDGEDGYVVGPDARWGDGIAPVLAWGFTPDGGGCVLVLAPTANGETPMWTAPFNTGSAGWLRSDDNIYRGQAEIKPTAEAQRGKGVDGRWWSRLTYDSADYIAAWADPTT